MTCSPVGLPALEWKAGRSKGKEGRSRGFTLLEVIIVMVIISVLAGLAFPVVSSMMREAEMREPVDRLQELAKAVRLRALLEGYPYEIIFTAEGFEGRRFQLRGEGEEDNGVSEEDDASDEDGKEGEKEKDDANAFGKENKEETGEDGEQGEESGDEKDPDARPAMKLPELEAYEFASRMGSRLLFWGRTRWIDPPLAAQKEQIPVYDRWIFQPSGLCNPLRVQFYRENAWIEITFNPLTADIQSETSQLPD